MFVLIFFKLRKGLYYNSLIHTNSVKKLVRIFMKIMINIYDKKTYRLFVELTLVLLLDLLEIIESPQFTTVPLLIENVLKR